MTTTFDKRKEEFATECKIINLRFEYENHTGDEHYAIVTSLTEKEFDEKYGEIANCYYAPYLLLSPEQGDAIIEYQNIEAKYRMRNLRFGHAFDINDGEFEEHHPELAIEIDFVEKIELQDNIKKLKFAMTKLNQKQKKRIIDYFFYNKTYEQIAVEEGVTKQSIDESIKTAIKKLKKIF